MEKTMATERILKEIIVMKQVGQHPNVCVLLEVIDSPDAIHLVTEYGPNGERKSFHFEHNYYFLSI